MSKSKKKSQQPEHTIKTYNKLSDVPGIEKLLKRNASPSPELTKYVCKKCGCALETIGGSKVSCQCGARMSKVDG
jgi:hypothetical protein